MFRRPLLIKIGSVIWISVEKFAAYCIDLFFGAFFYRFVNFLGERTLAITAGPLRARARECLPNVQLWPLFLTIAVQMEVMVRVRCPAYVSIDFNEIRARARAQMDGSQHRKRAEKKSQTKWNGRNRIEKMAILKE